MKGEDTVQLTHIRKSDMNNKLRPTRGHQANMLLSKSIVGHLSILLLIATSLAVGETVTVRSGNGVVGGRDGSVTFLLGPVTGNFGYTFTQTDFSAAQTGPAAFILIPNAAWISSLSGDSMAQWIGTNPNASASLGNTALYAVPFTLLSPFNTAGLVLSYSADDGIGESAGGGPNTGVYLNGTAVCGNSFTIGFTQEHTVSCGDVGGTLLVGTNYLYIENGNAAGVAGLLFSATITTTAPVFPTITAGGIVNAGSYTSPIAPGSIASAFGTFPVSSPLAAPSAQSANWPTTLAGLSMQFGSVPAPLYYVSNDHVNFQVPWQANGKSSAEVTVTANSETSSPQFAAIASYAPSVFAMNGEGNGQGAIIDENYRLVDSSNPATPSKTVIAIYCTGLGAVTNQPATGAPAPTDVLAETMVKPTVTVGGAQATVLFSGLAPGWIGEYQVNARVPAFSQLGPAVPVTLSIGGVQSNTVTIAVGPVTQPNPQPSITSLSPSTAQAGLGVLTLTINGSGFISSSTVTFNGVRHTASFVNGDQLMITLSASDLATAGSFPVVVANPPPGGGNSNAVNFAITSPISKPEITSISPVSPTVSPNNQTITVDGSQFQSGLIVYIGLMSPPVAPSAAQILNVTATAFQMNLTLGSTGSWSIQVLNPDGGKSNVFTFNVAPASELTGEWQGTWTSSQYSLVFGALSANLTQTGAALGGTASFASSPCITSGAVSGSVNGNTLSASIDAGNDQTVTLTASINPAGTSITGNYTLAGGTCAPSGDSGTFNLARSQ